MEKWHVVLGVREGGGEEHPFVLQPHDRRHHLYVVGKSGVGNYVSVPYNAAMSGMAAPPVLTLLTIQRTCCIV